MSTVSSGPAPCDLRICRDASQDDVAFGDEERATFLGYIASESERLIGIVNDLLSVARSRAGTLEWTWRLSTWPRFLEPVGGGSPGHIDGPHRLETGRLRAPLSLSLSLSLSPSPSLSLSLSRSLSLWVAGGGSTQSRRGEARPDPPAPGRQRHQVLARGGTISLAGRRKTDAIEVRVSDEGIGIPIDDQSRIFTKFYRAGTAPLTGAHGTGLGALPRARASGGDGRAHRRRVSRGRGVDFRLRAPCLEERATGKSPSGTGGTLMTRSDDRRRGADSPAVQGESRGGRHGSGRGTRCPTRAGSRRERAAGCDPPRGDDAGPGRVVGAERLLEMEDTREIPIVFLTARADLRDRARGMDLGGLDYITKPFNPVDLASLVEEVVSAVARGEREQLRADKIAELRVLFEV